MSAQRDPDRPSLPDGFERSFVAFVRSFGLLQPEATPCGARLPVSEAHALSVLAEEGARSQGQLAGSLRLTKSTVSRLVDQLEQRGWIQRLVSDTDARVRIIDLTAAGRTVAADIAGRRRARLGALLERIPASERDAVLAAFTTLLEATRDLDPT